MAKKITITDDKFLEVSTKIASEIAPSPVEYLKVGLVISVIAAELFSDEEEKEEEEGFHDLFEKIVDGTKYSVFTGGNVCKDDFVLMRETLSTGRVEYTRRFKTFNDAISSLINDAVTLVSITKN